MTGPQHGMSDEEFFWQHVDKSAGPDACWPWTGFRNKKGYGLFSAATKSGKRKRATTAAYRFAYELANGPIPPGLLVRHKCDNPPCCNPQHLLIGKHFDNSQDAVRSRNARVAALDDAAISDMRAMLDSGVTIAEIAAKYKITRGDVRHAALPPQLAPYMSRYKRLSGELVRALGSLPKLDVDRRRLETAAKQIAKKQIDEPDPAFTVTEAVERVFATAAAMKAKEQAKRLCTFPPDFYPRIEQAAQASGLTFAEALRAGLERAFPPVSGTATDDTTKKPPTA